MNNQSIVMDEKEKWALYFSEYLLTCGYPNAAKVLKKIAHGPDLVLHKVDKNLHGNELIAAITKVIEEQKIIDEYVKPYKPSLAEDIHGDRDEQNV